MDRHPTVLASDVSPSVQRTLRALEIEGHVSVHWTADADAFVSFAAACGPALALVDRSEDDHFAITLLSRIDGLGLDALPVVVVSDVDEPVEDDEARTFFVRSSDAASLSRIVRLLAEAQRGDDPHGTPRSAAG